MELDKAGKHGRDMQRNATKLRMSKEREKAALLVAEDKLTDEQIASKLGIHKVTLERWKQRPEFRTRVQEHKDKWARALEAKGVASKELRVDVLNDLHESLRKLKAERAVSPLMENVAGGGTGLLVAEPILVKVYSSDGEEGTEDETLTPIKQSRIAYKYALDKALVQSILDIQKQVAQEMGQWDPKSGDTDKDLDDPLAAMNQAIRDSVEALSGAE